MFMVNSFERVKTTHTTPDIFSKELIESPKETAFARMSLIRSPQEPPYAYMEFHALFHVT